MSSAAAAGPSKGRAVLFGACKLGIALLLCWLVLRKVDFPRAFAIASQLPLRAAAGAMGLLLLQAVLSAWRWALISRRTQAPLTLGPAFRLFMISMFYNQALPSTVPGDAARVWGAARFGGAQEAVMGVLLDRLVTLAALGSLAAVSLGILAFHGRGQTMAIPFLVLAGMALGFGMIAVGVAARDWVCGFLPAKVAILFRKAAVAVHEFFKSGRFPFVFAGSLFIHGLSVAAIYVLALGIHLPMAFWEAMIAVPVVMLAAQLPVSVNGWGVREGAMVLVLAKFGIGRTEAATLSVVFGLFQLALGLAGGVFALFPERGVNAKASPRTSRGLDR